MARAPHTNFHDGPHQRRDRQWLYAAGVIVTMAMLTGCGKNSEAAGGPGGGMPPMPVTVVEANPQQVPVIILLSSLVGAMFGLSLVALRGRDRSIPIPFGPYLACAGWIALIWGDAIIRFYWHWAMPATS